MVKQTAINQTKINKLIQDTPKGLVLLSSWLLSKGYSYELQQRYRNGGWLKSIGNGAMLKSGDPLLLSGALSALQTQLKINLHFGGRSALELQGKTHYLQLNSPEVTLFALGRTELPPWFVDNKWDFNFKIFRIGIFNDDMLGLTKYREGELEVNISNPTRAMIECLALSPNEFSLNEAFELMEGLATLRPGQVQELLENCKSIKAKRLFLFFAERAGHSWYKYIDQTKIGLGSGKRSISPNGVFVPKYNLVIPKDLAETVNQRR
ncbi:MAG: type IV toxin-antitoxin system AbiEi family antitoxin domain-containing protein [Rikenellaceae bacterium]|nr:type IV toxin-antitoxin system AbiEi family antitoxin domain-containing protein [Rikenellaceae bacterium]